LKFICFIFYSSLSLYLPKYYYLIRRGPWPRTSKPGIGVCPKEQEVLSLRICGYYIHCIFLTRAKHECSSRQPGKFGDKPQRRSYGGEPGHGKYGDKPQPGNTATSPSVAPAATAPAQTTGYKNVPTPDLLRMHIMVMFRFRWLSRMGRLRMSSSWIIPMIGERPRRSTPRPCPGLRRKHPGQSANINIISGLR